MERKEKTEITCFCGHTQKDTWMAAMIQAGYQEKRVDYQHIPLEIKEQTLEKAMDAVRLLGMKGVALGEEYRKMVFPFLDEVSLSAEICGQVSAICNRDGRLLGENMEGKGLLTALLNAGVFLHEKTVTIAGKEDMAKAAAAECALAGAAKIYLLQKKKRVDAEMAEQIAKYTSAEVKTLLWEEEKEIPKETDILIAAEKEESYCDSIFSELHFEGEWKQVTVCDMAIRSRKPEWLKAVRREGARVIDGKEMLVSEAALVYSFWSEHIAPVPLFYDILHKTLHDEKEEREQKADTMMQGEKMKKADQKLIEKMIEYYAGDPKRIQHFLKVYTFACLIGKAEKLDTDTFFILKTAAVVHDIGIRISEEKYGSSAGKYQEIEGPSVAEPLLRSLGYDEEVMDRVLFLIANHHTYGKIEGADYQILVEADFLVNLYEDSCNRNAVENAQKNIFRTKTGRWYLEQMFLCGSGNNSSHPVI